MSDARREWIKHARVIELTHGNMQSIDEFRLHLQRLQPDAIHAMGCTHDGGMDYPTSVGPGAKDDTPVRERIDVARQLGIKVIAQHSGVGNTAAGEAHPEWIRTTATGAPSDQKFAGWQMDLLGDYPEQWFLVQVEEMLRDYGVDGIWVDGDCWYTYPCYSPPTLERFKAQTGLDAPRIDDVTWQRLHAPTTAGAGEHLSGDEKPPELDAEQRMFKP